MKPLLLALLTLIAVLFLGMAAERSADARLPEVTVASGTYQRVEKTVSCSGKVTAENVRTVSVSQAACVREIFVSEGDSVKAGDVLFTCSLPAGVDIAGDDEFLQAVFSDGELLADILTGNIPRDVLNLSGLDDIEDVFSGGATCEVTAPIDGVITKLYVSAGSVTIPFISCADICDTSSLYIVASVPENEIYRIHLGQTARITVRGANEKLQAVVTGLPMEVSDPLAELTGTELTGKVRLDLSESSEALPGMSCTVKIVYDVTQNAYTVPYDALREDDEGWYLYTTEGAIVEKTYVDYIADVGDRVQIKTESNNPFYYLTDTGLTWKDGQRVRAVLEEAE